jgi:Serine/threonine protein phosphatase
MRLRIAWATDPGLEREENEDAVVVWRNKAGLDTLLVVCDGMGGHAAGQTASSIASKTATSILAGWGRGSRHGAPEARLQASEHRSVRGGA